MHILIIEDRPEDRELITRRLKCHFTNVQLTEISNENAFCQALDQGTFDLVLTDYILGWTDGLQVLRTVQARFPQVPVVMFTESGSEEIAVEGMREGLSDYLLKKHLERLPAAIQTSLERARLQIELDQTMRDLRQSHSELEARVRERTAELAAANAALQAEAQERERLVVETQRQAAELDSIFSAMPDLVAVYDGQGRITRINPAGEQLMRYPAERYGQPVAERMALRRFEAGEERRPIAPEETPAGRALRGETVQNELIAMVEGPEEKVTWLLVSATPVHGPEGEITGVVAVSKDITEQKRAEVALRETRDYLDNLLTYANAPIIVWDPALRITRFNNAFERLTGLKSEAVLGHPLDLLFPEDRKEEALEHIRRTTAGERWEAVEIPIQRADGTARTVLWNSATLYAADGTTVVATIAQGQDITERKWAKVQLAANLEAMTRLRQLGTLFVREGNLEPVLGEIVEAAVALSDADFGSIQLVDRRSGDLRIAAQQGFPQWWIDFWNQVSAGQGSYGTALERGKRVIVEDVEQSPIFAGTPALDVQRQAGVRAVQSTPLRSQSGKLLGMFSTHYRTVRRPDERTLQLLDLLANQAADIIERAQAEQALRESEEKYRLIVENAQEGIWTVNADRQTLYVNERMAEMLGYTVPEFMETPWTELVRSGEERKGSDRRVQERRQGLQRSRESYEMQLNHKDGSVIWVIINSTPLFNEHGEYIGSTSMLSDITDRKRFERELFAVNQHLAALLKALPVGASYSIDATCQRIDGNPALWAQFEMTPADNISASAPDPAAVGRRVSYFYQGRELADTELPLQQAVAEGREVPPVELEILLPSGRRWYAMASAAPIYDQAGRIAGGIAVTVDITDRKQAEQERERLLAQTRQDAETKVDLLKEVNHRVKNNLAAIVGLLYAHLDRAGASSAPEYRALVRELSRRIDGLSIVHGLLSRSQWAPVRLDELAERILSAVLRDEPRGKVMVEIAPSSLLISPDQAQTLALVLNELALNVAKHTASGTGVRVNIEAVQDQNLIALTVRDNGPGYPEPVIAGQEAGIGLGLLRNLVRQNLRGQIVLRNEGGALAEIRFPLMGPASGRANRD